MPDNLPSTQQRVFEAVLTRLIAAFYPPCLKEVTSVDGTANRVPFRARGVRVVRPGWTELERRGGEDQEDDQQPLPAFTPGESGPHEPFIKQGGDLAAAPLHGEHAAGRHGDSGQVGGR